MKAEKRRGRRHLKSTKPVHYQFNVRRMVRDLGGVGLVSERTGLCRTTIYRWIYSGILPTSALELIRSTYPSFGLECYLEPRNEPVLKNEDGEAVS